MRTALMALDPRLHTIRQQAEKNWLLLQEPVQLWAEHRLILNPRGIALSPLAGQGDRVDAHLAVLMVPEMVRGAAPAPRHRSLPPLIKLSFVNVMYNKVFGIGSPKTGTSSLGIAFEILGLKHQGWSAILWDYYVNNDFNPIFKVVEDYDAFEDGPWNGPDLYYQKGVDFYKILDERYHNSRFILTIRDISNWALSHEFHFTTDGRKGRRAKYRIPDYAKHRTQIISNYERRNHAIKKYFINRPNDLLVMNICAGDGWETLCPFLNLSPPDRPFPHMNKTKS